MSQVTFPNDVFVQGSLSARTFTPPLGSVGNSAIAAAAGIEATKVVHQFPLNYSQPSGSAVAAATLPVHIAKAVGSVVSIEASLDTPPTTTDTVTIDLHKGNAGSGYASILSAPIVLDNANVARAPEVGTVSSGTLADGDILRLVVTVSGTSAQGLIVTITARENPQ